MVRTLRRSSSDTQLERLARELIDEADERGDGDGLPWWEAEEVVESEMSEFCHIKLWVRGMVNERKLRRLLLLGIDAATAQLMAEEHLGGPLSPSRTLCAQVVEPTLKLWQQIATSPSLTQTHDCLDVVTMVFEPALPRWLLGVCE